MNYYFFVIEGINKSLFCHTNRAEGRAPVPPAGAWQKGAPNLTEDLCYGI